LALDASILASIPCERTLPLTFLAIALHCLLPSGCYYAGQGSY